VRDQVVRAVIFAFVFGISQYVMQDPKPLLDLLIGVAVATVLYAAFMALADKLLGDEQ
jgi:NADH:ubiquinone oxidoreductase subunit 2 (subunit N)